MQKTFDFFPLMISFNSIDSIPFNSILRNSIFSCRQALASGQKQKSLQYTECSISFTAFAFNPKRFAIAFLVFEFACNAKSFAIALFFGGFFCLFFVLFCSFSPFCQCFWTVWQTFFTYVSQIATQNACDQCRTNLIGYTEKILLKKCFFSCYLGRVWPKTCHVLQFIHSNQY